MSSNDGLQDVKQMKLEATTEVAVNASMVVGRIINSQLCGLNVYASVSYDIQDDNSSFLLNVDLEDIERSSLSPHSAGVYDIVGLLTQGWNIPRDKKTPFGIWHGKFITARRMYVGREILNESKMIDALYDIDDVVEVVRDSFNSLYVK